MTPTSDSFTYSGATTDITPSRAKRLAGYAARRTPSDHVASRLEANALLVCADNQRMLFVAVDVLFIARELVTAVTQRAAHFGLSSDNVVVTASHTHFAPATDRTKPLLGPVDDQYSLDLEKRLVDLVTTVMTLPPTGVAVEHSRAETHLNVSRRRLWTLPTLTRRGLALRPRIVMAPSLDAERDSRIDVVRLVDASGAVRGVFWKFACHPVCFPDSQSISSEFPGIVRDALRANVGDDIPVVFWQGFGGDVRPRIETRVTLSERLLELSRGPRFGRVTADAWASWASEVAATVVALATSASYRRLSGPLSSSVADVGMDALIDTTANPRWHGQHMRVQRVWFGSKSVLFVGAEVCSPYLRLLGPDDDTIFVGYAGEVFGYLPSAGQQTEGGYEGRDFFESFSLKGGLKPGFEDAVRVAMERTCEPQLRVIRA